MSVVVPKTPHLFRLFFPFGPATTTDGLRGYFYALTTHFWRVVSPPTTLQPQN